MDYSQIALLFSQATFVALVMLLLFHFRKQLGIGVMFACLGLFQFVQVFLYSAVSVSITDTFKVSPGSAIFFTSTLFVLLIMYIKEDASETKKTIYALFIVNIVMAILLQILSWYFSNTSTPSPFNLSTSLFNISSWELFVGTITLFLDAFLIIFLFEYISKKIRFLFWQISLTMLIVLSFDTLFFVSITFWNTDNLNLIIISGLVSKAVFSIFYSTLLYFYLKYFDKTEILPSFFNLRDVFQPLTYKQKFESATKEIKKSEEMYRILTDHSNDLICLQELDSTFKYISPSIKTILGYEESEFLGKQVFGIVHEEDLFSLKEAMNQKKFSGKVIIEAFPFRVRHKDGHFVWLEFLASPVYENDIISYFVTTARDITHRVLAKEKIEASLALIKKREAALYETSKIAKIGYHEYDIATDVFTWSEYVYRILGLDPKEEIPSREAIMSFFDKETQDIIEQNTAILNEEGISYDIEVKIINLKKEEVWIRNVIHPVYNEKNELVGRRGVLQNITQAKKVQLELETSKEKIQYSLGLLEKREYALNETSRIAKVGYWEYSIIKDTFIWSDYVYQIYGYELKDKIPSRKEMIAFYDDESQKKLAAATLNLNSNNVSYDIELRLFNLKNEEVWVRNVVQNIYNHQNEVVGRKGVLHNITDFKKTQLELELSKQKIQTSLELLEKRKYSMIEASKVANIGYWQHDLLTNVTLWSDYVYQIFGLDPKDGAPSQEEVFNSFNKESREKLEKATEDLLLKGVPFDLELRFINLKNEEIWSRNVAQPIYNLQKEIVGKRGVMQNITDAKRAQFQLELSKQEMQISLEQLETSQNSLNEASKVAKIGYWEYSIVEDTFTWSDYVYQIYGLDPKEDTPSREQILHRYDKESQDKIHKISQNIELMGGSCDVELKMINFKNKEVWERTVAQAIYNEHNEIIGRRGVMQDITEAKKAQLQLELSKQEVENSLELLKRSEYSKNEVSKIAKIGYQEYDIVTSTYIWSDYIYYILEFDSQNGVPPLHKILPKFDEESQKKIAQAALDIDTKGIPCDIEVKFINLKKEEVWLRYVAQPVYNEDSSVVGRKGVLYNITDAKLTQLELEFSKEEIQTSLDLLENNRHSLNEASKVAKIGYLEYDIATSIFKCSDYVYEMLGVDAYKELPNREEVFFLFDKESQKIIKKTDKDIDLRGLSCDVELKCITKNKEEVWMRCVAQPVYNEQNKIIGRRGVLQNITDSKKAQFELELSKEKIQTSLDLLEIKSQSMAETSKIAKIGYHEYDIATDTFIWSEYLYRIFGFDLDKELLSRKEVLNFFDKESKEKLIQATLNLDLNGTPYDLQLKLTNKKNEEVWVRNVAQPVYSSKNKLIGRRGITQDITESKKAQLALEFSRQEILTSLELVEENEYSLKEAGRMAKVGYWGYSKITDTITWSNAVHEIYGTNSEIALPKLDVILDFFNDESKNKLIKATENLAINGTPFDIELSLTNLKNEKRWIRNIGEPVYNDKNEIIARRGISQDITEQKLIRSKIEEAEEMYRLLTDNSNDLICLHEINSQFKYISPSIKNLLGYEQSELLGKKVFDIVHEDDMQSLKNVMKERMFGKVFIDAFVCRILHKKGHYIWLEFLSSPVYEGEEISYYVSSSRDITQWILAKQEIQEYQTSLQKLTTEMTLIEEKQKKEIATNIHDHLSQSLVISKMKINELKKRPQLKEIDEDLKFIETHISEALENSRKITYELSPPVLYQLGIIEALNWLFDNVETTHKIKCLINSNVDSVNLNEVKSILLYRSIQEVLTNAIKYANASLITLDLDKNKLGLDIIITDNGVGFNTSILSSLHNHSGSGSGFGLFTVQERIKNIQGDFTINSTINLGTTIKIFIPLSK